MPRGCGRGSPTDPQPAEPVQQRDRLLDHPAVPPRPEPCSVPRRAITGVIPLARTYRRYLSWSSPGRRRPPPGARVAATPAADRRDRRDQWHQLGDVVTLAAGQRHHQRDPVRFSDHTVLGARARSTGLGPRFGSLQRTRASCQSLLRASPTPRPRSVRLAAARAVAATRPPRASPAAAASRSSRTRTQLLRQEPRSTVAAGPSSRPDQLPHAYHYSHTSVCSELLADGGAE
jgi:hypothetical protein